MAGKRLHPVRLPWNSGFAWPGHFLLWFLGYGSWVCCCGFLSGLFGACVFAPGASAMEFVAKRFLRQSLPGTAAAHTVPHSPLRRALCVKRGRTGCVCHGFGDGLVWVKASSGSGRGVRVCAGRSCPGVRGSFSASAWDFVGAVLAWGGCWRT